MINEDLEMLSIKDLGVEDKITEKIIKFSLKRYNMPKKEYLKFSDKQKEKYVEALRYVFNNHAGGYDGWSVGHKLLKELGFKEHIREEGHRFFVSLKYEINNKNSK
jgi:hypothetical protein